MNIYPVLVHKAGNWKLFSARMKPGELVSIAKLAKSEGEVSEIEGLDDYVQRGIKKGRPEEIANYLTRQEDRFLPPIILGVKGGEPRFFPVTIDSEDDSSVVFSDLDDLGRCFGFLRFDGTESYYILDGQHRLAGIKAVLESKVEFPSDFDLEEFKSDQLPVLLVFQSGLSDEEIRIKYQRLFTHVNRYAVPTKDYVNIIMDEDDAISILTRRLRKEHEFFKKEDVVKIEGGKNLKYSTEEFTTIEGLNNLNKLLLTSEKREQGGWGGIGEKLDDFQRFRPSENEIDEMYEEITTYWDSIFKEIPELLKPPTFMRNHGWESGDPKIDHLLFWPIGQELMASMVRKCIDKAYLETVNPEGVSKAIRGMGKLEWRMHSPPWKYFALVPDPLKRTWRVRSEDRKKVMDLGKRIQLWALGLGEEGDREDSPKEGWLSYIISTDHSGEAEKMIDEMWEDILAKKQEIQQFRGGS